MSLNPAGFKMNMLLPGFAIKRPVCPELDLSGEVVLANDTEFVVGDEVVALIHPDDLKSGNGALMEYAVVRANLCVLKPKNVDFQTASGIGIVGATAYQGLVDMAQVEEGQRVFVNGGSSGCGIWAIQIARARGCEVDASCSARNTDFVKSLGAEEVFDYTASPLHEQLIVASGKRPYHVIFDAVDCSPPLYTNSPKYLHKSGIYLSTGPHFSSIWEFFTATLAYWRMAYTPTWLGGTPRTLSMWILTPTKERLQAVADLVTQGKVKPQVDSVFALSDVQKAYDRLISGRARGKVVVQLL